MLLPNCKHIDEVLVRTRLMLMPSLWYEGFGLSVMEAMLHAIPVVASDSGGLVEAKAGTGFVVPVRAIERFESSFDERGMPKPVVEATVIEPWVRAVGTLLGDRSAYRRESAASREAAVSFASGLRAGLLEEFLRSLQPNEAARGAATLMESLSPAEAGAAVAAAAAGEKARLMRILLAQNSLYYPSHGGGDRSNRLLMEALAARGHECLAVARMGSFGPRQHADFLRDLEARSVQAISAGGGVVTFRLHGVEIHVATDHPQFRAYFAGQIARFQPDVILTSTDDPAQLLLEAALKAESARVVYLARATLAVPFGPDCAFPSEPHTAVLRQVAGAVGVSQYVADYIRRWSGIPAIHVPISLIEPGPYADLGRFENEFATLVNPCAVKGISIFTGLAARMPEAHFAAVPTWGTSQEDLDELARFRNIAVLPPEDDVDRILERTRVLLVPSLWAEARSRIVVEAMLRGIPVLAADVGGIPEAKMGVDYLLPVRPIERYATRLDERMVPVAEVPAQDLAPWQDALSTLADRERYQALSRRSRERALDYARNLSVLPFEGFLQETVRARRTAGAMAAAPTGSEAARPGGVESLTPEKRQLLALRLRQRNRARWFPGAAAAAKSQVRLFCFPHAGGGAAAFARWGSLLPPRIAVCPARLPGRESRLSEEPIHHMAALVDALAEAIQPYLGQPFAFFGHSMGAVAAFELAQHLHRVGAPLPGVLCVSGARAPRFRLGWNPPPEPSDAQFLEELRRLEGLPAEVLQNDAMLRIVLPALRADAGLYRQYIYTEQPPLRCPIRAYGGDADPNVTAAHLEAWREHTACSFAWRMYPGGHFFIHTAQADFLEALGRDVLAFGS